MDEGLPAVAEGSPAGGAAAGGAGEWIRMRPRWWGWASCVQRDRYEREIDRAG